MSERREMLLVFAAAKQSQIGSMLIFESGQSSCVKALVPHSRLVITGSQMGRIEVEATDKCLSSSLLNVQQNEFYLNQT